MSNFIRKWVFKPRYIVIFLMKQQKTLYVVNVIKLKSITTWLKGKGKKYLINPKSPSYVKENKRIYFVDFKDGNQYMFHEIDNGITPEQTDQIIGSRVVKEIISGVMDNKKQLILYFVIGIIIGVLTGALIMSYIKQGKIDELYDELRNTQPVIFNWIRGLRL